MKRAERRRNIFSRPDFENFNINPEVARYCRNLGDLPDRRWIADIGQDCQSAEVRERLTQEFNSWARANGGAGLFY